MRRRKKQELTPEQLAVVNLESGPARVLAGAGSGKTHTMTALISKKIQDHRNEYSDDEGVPPERILAITFTVKAAEEMRERLEGRVREDASKLEVSNFHRLAFEISRDNSVALNIAPDAPVLRRPRAWMMVLDDLSSDDLSLRRLDLSHPATVAEDTLQLLGQARNERTSLDALEERTLQDLEHRSITPDLRDFFKRRLDLITLARRFEARREVSGQLQYGDMIESAIRVLEDDALGAPYRDRYDLIVVDEFQDTNPAQLRLVELLSADGSGHPDLSKVIVIGDDLQSIFNFQGAAIQNIQRFEEYAGLSVNNATYQLKRNFRSATRILDFANYVAADVHPENSPDGVKTLLPREDAPVGEVRTFVAGTDGEEAEEIAARTSSLVEDGAAAGECAVLIRKWSQAPAVMDALGARGLPCEIVRGGDLLGSPEVAYLTDILRLFADLDGNAEALVRTLSRDPYTLSDGDLEAVFQGTGAFQVSLAFPERVEGLSGEGARRVAGLKRVLDTLEDGLSRATMLEEFIETAVETTGLGREVRSIPTRGVRRLAMHGIEAYRDVAGEFGTVERLEDFLRYIDVSEGSRSSETTEPPEVEGDAVILTTVHGAKGLEFDHVFVPGLSKGVFPDSVKIDHPLKKPWTVPPSLKTNPSAEASKAYDALDGKALEAALRREAEEEEGRLFYVAITRARRSLTLSRAHFYRTNKDKKAEGAYWQMAHEAPESCAIPTPEDPGPPDHNPNLRKTELWTKPEGDEWVLQATRGDKEEEAGIAAELGVEGYEDTLHSLREDVRAIPEVERPEYILPAPEVHSPSSLMEFEVCPRRYYYGHVFPVVEAFESGQRSRDHGDAWHKWIEGGAKGEVPALPPDDLNVDTTEDDENTGPVKKTDFRQTPYGIKASTYPLHKGDVPPRTGPARMVEVPFSIEVNDSEIRGRIDAVFVDEDGTVHIIDWKSGRKKDSYKTRLQLPLYALAASKLWKIPPGNIRLAYVFASGEKVEVPFGESHVESTEKKIGTSLASIRSGHFPPKPSEYACKYCPVFGIGIEGCPKDESGIPGKEAPV